MSKLVSLEQAAKLIGNDQIVAVGGNALHRNPVALCRAVAKNKPVGLTVVGAAPGLAADILCAADCVKEIWFGFFGFENEFGLAAGMRKGVQSGKIKAMEGS
jgi:glutaconate CoA-transferase subunit A